MNNGYIHSHLLYHIMLILYSASRIGLLGNLQPEESTSALAIRFFDQDIELTLSKL